MDNNSSDWPVDNRSSTGEEQSIWQRNKAVSQHSQTGQQPIPVDEVSSEPAKTNATVLGHHFSKKNFPKPATCHHCTEILWGLLRTTGYVCKICNLILHEKCLKNVVSPCTTLIPFLTKEPVAHCWSEAGHFKRKYCNVCRKRVDDIPTVRCEICEYYSHVNCMDYVASDCKQCSTSLPHRSLEDQLPQLHHWREGNLSSSAKCSQCKKLCYSSECLTGMQCEWCGITAHNQCYQSIDLRCDLGVLREIILPPCAVSVPRTSVILEHIIGMQKPKQEHSVYRTISEDFSSSGDSHEESGFEKRSYKVKPEKEYDDYVRVYDGNARYRKRQCRYMSFGKHVTVNLVIEQILKTFHLPPDNVAKYCLVEINERDGTETILDENIPFKSQLSFENRRPQILLRYRPSDSKRDYISVYPGTLAIEEKVANHQLQLPITEETTAYEALMLSLRRFGVEHLDANKYYLVETSVDNGTWERALAPSECLWDIVSQMKLESVRSFHLLRFYIRPVADPHGTGVALFVGNLKKGLSQRLYERILMDKLGIHNKWDSLGVIYYDFGSLVLLYEDVEKADKAYNILKESTFEEKSILVLILPRIQAQFVPPDVQPLLVFVNVKSGGCQGIELITWFRKLLNPHQVFNLDFGGPLPGLYCFNQLQKYKILVCGGDGTVGWALSCLDNVGQDAVCQHPAMAIVPLGTGNDLARVLRWGPGYTGGEDALTLLKHVVDAEEISLDRWTVMIKPDQMEVDEEKRALQLANNAANTNEETTRILVMNNYFGIGIDADLNLDFHLAREENPAKFNSRIHNKGVYFKMGLRKMVNRTKCKDLNQHIVVEVDGRVIDLPPLEGIIILNILSWGAGANPWGFEKEDHFAPPTHYDGMLEVVGVTGVVHMGQIFSSLRTGNRLAQGGHIRITLKTDIPVQIDGEPFIQSPGQIVVLRSALKATMLKKRKRTTKSSLPSSTMGGPHPGPLELASTSHSVAAAAHSPQPVVADIANDRAHSPPDLGSSNFSGLAAGSRGTSSGRVTES